MQTKCRHEKVDKALRLEAARKRGKEEESEAGRNVGPVIGLFVFMQAPCYAIIEA
jgi:hypothetical protein